MAAVNAASRPQATIPPSRPGVGPATKSAASDYLSTFGIDLEDEGIAFDRSLPLLVKFFDQVYANPAVPDFPKRLSKLVCRAW